MAKKEEKRKTLSVAVIMRNMDDAEWDKFIHKYDASKLSGHVGANRADNLSVPITEEEKECLKFYIDNTDEPLSVHDKALGKKANTTYRAALRGAIKYLYQNRTLLKE